MKYILVTGGVISGIGKGIIASSVGTILKSCGLHVTSIKIDPYINIDAGTFSPYEHGEVFVLDDGGEVDLDLGNYERFLDIRLTKDNNLTTGKIYQYVINKERKGDYLGKTVQVVPHITDAIQEWVMRQALIPVDEDGLEPQVCVIELGGTVGDIESMPFIEAFRQFQFKVKRENFCNIHVSLVPQPSSTGEQKTKPTQNSVRELRGLGLSPDLVVCRCSNPLDTSVKEKISMFCHVEPEQVICVHDVSSIYRVPLLLEEQGVVDYFLRRLDLPIERQPRKMLMKWKEMADRYDRLLETCSIALVGKYTKFSDSYASVIKALEHSALAINHKLEIKYVDSTDLEHSTLQEEPVRYHEAWQKLCSAHGVLVPGGFGVRGTEGKIQAISWARKQKKPFLGVCLGMQLAVVEFSRNVLGWQGKCLLVLNSHWNVPGACWTVGAMEARLGFPVSHSHREGKLLNVSTENTLLSSRGTTSHWRREHGEPPASALAPFSGDAHTPVTMAVDPELAHGKETNSGQYANSTEFDPNTNHPVVIDMPEHNPGQMGGTMRLGKRRTLFQTKNSVMRKLYGDPDYLEERHRHRFEVNPVLKKCLEEQGLKFVGQDVEGERMEIVELEDHPFFVGVQYHPEFLSRPIKPSPPYFGLLLASVGRLPHYLQKGCRLSPRDTYSDRSGSSSPDSEITELKFPSINHD
ncbi:CTP synthase 1 isoform X2 [Ovis aries]|uniref:CTP synthase 1 n=3 Tax=Ovis aries TaxID=9940 RepID=A0AC11DX94_SHEEP|nr:CTP synthase 1 isoform X2 [Ovis aries]